ALSPGPPRALSPVHTRLGHPCTAPAWRDRAWWHSAVPAQSGVDTGRTMLASNAGLRLYVVPRSLRPIAQMREEPRMSPRAPILTVDDSGPIRDMIVSVLAARGRLVITARDGHQGLQRLPVPVEPFVILLDIVMPVLDGIRFCNELAQDVVLRQAGHCIILMSTAARLAEPDIPPTAA